MDDSAHMTPRIRGARPAVPVVGHVAPANRPWPRRAVLGLALGGGAAAAWPADAEALIRAGGLVVAFRHALAPGTFDPPEFRLGDCGTQRNLNDEGRAQARRIGAWFRARGLQPARVLSSPWCRCVDTATLAFSAAQPVAALGSPRGASESTNAQSLGELRHLLAMASARRGQFEVWVTHMFVLSDLVGQGSQSGEGLLLRADGGGQPQVLARLAPA
jgi:Histidine phosphatase superfamily (branch 1)